MAERVLRLLRALLAAALLAACVGTARSEPTPGTSRLAPSLSVTPITLSISNGTTIAVALVVNGAVVETVAPGGYEDPIKAELPALPWSIEARSPSGRVLSSLTVRAGDVWPTAFGHSEIRGDAVRVDLACGRLDIWSGPPLLGPTFIPGPSGDCA